MPSFTTVPGTEPTPQDTSLHPPRTTHPYLHFDSFLKTPYGYCPHELHGTSPSSIGIPRGSAHRLILHIQPPVPVFCVSAIRSESDRVRLAAPHPEQTHPWPTSRLSQPFKAPSGALLSEVGIDRSSFSVSCVVGAAHELCTSCKLRELALAVQCVRLPRPLGG